MRWRIEFARKATAQKAGEVGRAFAVEVSGSRNEVEARAVAMDQAARERKADAFTISNVRKI